MWLRHSRHLGRGTVRLILHISHTPQLVSHKRSWLETGESGECVCTCVCVCVHECVHVLNMYRILEQGNITHSEQMLLSIKAVHM